MNEFPQIPNYYVKPTIDGMYPGDIYYPSDEIIHVDRITHRPYINKYEHLSSEDLRPRLMLGRFGIMRVFEARESEVLDGYIIDVRPVNFADIEQDDFTPRPDDSYDTIENLEEDRKDFISPLAIIAYVYPPEQEKVLFLGDKSLLSHMNHLVAHTNDLKNESDLHTAHMDMRRREMMARRPASVSIPTSNEAKKQGENNS